MYPSSYIFKIILSSSKCDDDHLNYSVIGRYPCRIHTYIKSAAVYNIIYFGFPLLSFITKNNHLIMCLTSSIVYFIRILAVVFLSLLFNKVKIQFISTSILWCYLKFSLFKILPSLSFSLSIIPINTFSLCAPSST
jgi:hypothetical protein